MRSSLSNEITYFLEKSGIRWDEAVIDDKEVIYTDDSRNGTGIILPYSITALSMDTAAKMTRSHVALAEILKEKGYSNILTITEDLWHRRPEMMRGRLLSHLGKEHSVYARNCEIRRIGKEEAGNFLNRYHSYGDASCRYRYGLYLKRYTGHNALQSKSLPHLESGTLVAVAGFSSGRKWDKGGKTIRSYEWTRYAGIPQVRICGGMGKVLRYFIEDIGPDDIMSYADLEWSHGAVYQELGFEQEGLKEPVEFYIEPNGWDRIPAKRLESHDNMLCYINRGSIKYRLKLTDWL